MPSPAVSHTIMTVAMLAMFIVVASSIQGLLVSYSHNIAESEAKRIVESATSQLTSAVLILERRGGESALVVLEFYRRGSGRTFYNIYLEGADNGVRVVVETSNREVREVGEVVGTSKPTNATLTNSITNMLSRLNVKVSGDGTSVYSGVPGPLVVWAFKSGGEVIVGLGWFER